jgi:hypothetical protein
MRIEQIEIIHEAMAEGAWIEAANLALKAEGMLPVIKTVHDAKRLLNQLKINLLDSGEYDGYLKCSALIWSKDLFNQGPESVQRVFKSLFNEEKLLIQGASSVSKTYSAIAFAYLDWLRDPEYTSVKLTSQTENHLLTNVWPHMLALHRANLLPPEGFEIQEKIGDGWFGVKGFMEYGFHGIAFKQSAVSTGTWRGFKPQPKRPKTHRLYPTYGAMTRLRVIIDEAGEVPANAWASTNSVLSSRGNDLVKVVACYNPESTEQVVVQMAEPNDGWNMDQLETLYSWVSKQGWQVERIDAAKTENVMQRKQIYHGLQTYEAYMDSIRSGGDNSARYYCFARGFPPLKDSLYTIIPPDWLSSQRGEAIYDDEVISVASWDSARMGGDKSILTVGRWGVASAWRNHKGHLNKFEDRLNPGKKRPRHVLTIDQVFTLNKTNDDVQAVQEVMAICKGMNISPEWVAIDATGGGGVHSIAKKIWGDVLGVAFGEKATEKKVLADDIHGAYHFYDLIPSELWFGFKRWLDPVVNAVLINSTVSMQPLFTQLTSRRFARVSAGRVKVENKDAYRARNGGHSPDEADAVMMAVFLLRQRGNVLPGLIESNAETNGRKQVVRELEIKSDMEADDTLDISQAPDVPDSIG